MAEVRISSQCERPCADVEETQGAASGAEGKEVQGAERSIRLSIRSTIRSIWRRLGNVLEKIRGAAALTV